MFTEADIPALLAELTLEEKASLLSGQDFWHSQAIERVDIPAMMMTDGPHGLRKQAGAADHVGVNASVPATCFPTAAGLASTWDPTLLRRLGETFGAEIKANNVGVILGPGVNIKRSPLCGRNFEYLSEDPLLAGVLASALVQGIQSQGVGTSLKHFAANNQETDRLRVDALVDERTLREIYLPAFERVVVEAQPATVMCAYNKLNGSYASENRWLLTDLLRDEWGFEGLVVSDWGAVNDRPLGVHAGLDLEMPSSRGINDARVVEAVRAGELSEADVDLAASRVLRMVACHQPVAAEGGSFDPAANHGFARELATRTAVLLKNDDGALPLPGLDGVVVIGEMARTPRYQGAGSSQVNPTFLDTALDRLRARDADLPFAPGYRLAEAAGVQDRDADDATLLAEAVELARGRTAVLFLGLPAIDESEGYDRTHLSIPESHRALLSAVAAVADRVIVALSNGSAVTTEWDADADAVLELWLGGQGGGEAAARLLLGEAAPSGRLAESIPVALGHLPAQLNFPGERGTVRYGEGIFVGYRGLDATGQAPAYPFGHGLTYTSFSYGALRVEATPVTAETPLDAVVLTATVTVTNTGPRPGTETAQLYVGRPSSAVARAPRELKAFARLDLAPGESGTAAFALTARDLAHWDVISHSWRVEAGPAVIEAGASAADLPERVVVDLTAPALPQRLTRFSTVREWHADEAAWADLQPRLGEFWRVLSPEGGADEALAVFLWDMPLLKLPAMFGALTAADVDELVARHG